MSREVSWSTEMEAMEPNILQFKQKMTTIPL